MKSFPDPRPRKLERMYTPFNFPVYRMRRLPKPTGTSLSLTDALRRRKSTRNFSVGLHDTDLATLLWAVCHVESSYREEAGFQWQHRPVPSAGGRHPIHVLAIQADSDDWRTWLYVAEDHILAALDVEAVALRGVINLAREVLSFREGALIWLAAEVDRTESKYANPETLIWRDAGALLGYMNLVASAHDLPVCARDLRESRLSQRCLKAEDL